MTVLMKDVQNDTEYVPHKKQKLALVLSSMRHFAAYLRDAGGQVEYVELDASENTGNFDGQALRGLGSAQPRHTAHLDHIQRLMLAGVAPAGIKQWYLEVYADAFE